MSVEFASWFMMKVEMLWFKEHCDHQTRELGCWLYGAQFSWCQFTPAWCLQQKYLLSLMKITWNILWKLKLAKTCLWSVVPWLKTGSSMMLSHVGWKKSPNPLHSPCLSLNFLDKVISRPGKYISEIRNKIIPSKNIIRWRDILDTYHSSSPE